MRIPATLIKTGLVNTPMVEVDLSYALTQVDPQRAHITLRIEDFDCITEERRYIFYNKGDQEISIIPLPARKREIQRNMKVEDSSKRNLVFIPSSSSTAIFTTACTAILEESDRTLDKRQKDAFKEIRDSVEPDLRKVFTYNPKDEDIESVYRRICDIPEREILKSEKFNREIIPLIELLEQYNKGLYYPLVSFPEPLKPRSYTLIVLSVERLREYLNEKWGRFTTLAKFGLLGRFTFSFEPELHPDISNHVRIYAPEGLLIRDVEFDLFEQQGDSNEKENRQSELEEKLNNGKKNYFDERCFHVQIGPEDSTIIYNCNPHFNLTFGLSKKGFHLGLLPLLSLFLWLTIMSPLFFEVLRSAQYILMLLTLSVTILVAIGIYALDKKIVNHYIITQIMLAFLVFIAEIIFMVVG